MSFIYGWKLSLVVISYVPIVIITNTVIGKVNYLIPFYLIKQLTLKAFTNLHTYPFQFQAILSVKEMNSYSAAANVAEEVLSGIRTVFAFGGEKVEIGRYNKRLIKAKEAVKMKGLLAGIGDGIMRFLFFGSNALAYWYGVQLVLDDRNKANKEYTPAVLMIVRKRTINSSFTSVKNPILIADILRFNCWMRQYRKNISIPRCVCCCMRFGCIDIPSNWSTFQNRFHVKWRQSVQFGCSGKYCF